MRALVVLLVCAAAARAEVVVPPERAQAVLFGDAAPPPACAGAVRCWLAERYARWPRARALALALYDELGDVAGSERELDMDGGFRGPIHLVPALPVGDGEAHLRWLIAAQREIETFAAAIERRAGKPLPYRHRGLAWRFFRSVGKRTPSAYAEGWEVAYNLVGSLNRDGDAVRDTMFHEIFHLNDFAHDTWSRRALGGLVDGILARCGAKPACLAPYTPTPMVVRATGMYYAFQGQNGDTANEYAAELATRWFHEQRAALRGERWPGAPFKCGPDENARAWQALGGEFFGGVDLVPACRER